MGSHSRQKPYKKMAMSGQVHDIIKCAQRLARLHNVGMVESSKAIPDASVINTTIIKVHDCLNDMVQYVRAYEQVTPNDDSGN